MVPLLLEALMLAPQVLNAGRSAYEMFTGEEAPETPEGLHEAIEMLPPEQRNQVADKIIESKLEFQRLDTERFKGLTEGSAEKIKSTARPEVALRCMAMMEMPFRLLRLVVTVIGSLLVLEWLIEASSLLFGEPVYMIGEDGVAVPVDGLDIRSPLTVIKELSSFFSWEGILAIVGPAYLAAVTVIKKYMGCRERDKAQEYEMQYGKPLSSAESTVVAATDAISSAVRLWKGRKQ